MLHATADFSLAADFGAGNACVLFVKNADGSRGKKEAKQPLLFFFG